MRNLSQPYRLTDREQAEVTNMDTEIRDSTISPFVHGILQSFPFRRVGDLPLPLAVLLAGDVEEQWWFTRQECKDKPPGVMPGIIQQVALKEFTLSNHVLQGANDAHETNAGRCDSGLKTSPTLPFLRIKAVERVCRHGLWLLVLPPSTHPGDQTADVKDLLQIEPSPKTMPKYKAPPVSIGPVPGTTLKVPPPLPPAAIVQPVEVDLLSFVDALVQPPMPRHFGINPPPKRTPDIPLLTPHELGLY